MEIRGKRVLLVEDDYFIADELSACLRRDGAVVQGPAPDISRAREILQEGRTDLALLDINLHGEFVFPLAEELMETGVPFLFATGYDRNAIPAQFSEIPVISKPFTTDALLRFLLSGKSPEGSMELNKLLARFPASAKNELRTHATLVPLLKGKVLARAGKMDRAYFPTSGLCALTLGPNSGSATVGVVGREGMIGDVRGLISVFHIVSQVPGFAIALPATLIWKIAQTDSRVLALLYDYSQNQLGHFAGAAGSAASSDITGRLARLLFVCADRIGPSLPLVHDSLAAMLDVRRAGVTEAMHVLEGEHAIRAHRGRIDVLNAEKLRRIAGSCYLEAQVAFDRLVQDGSDEDRAKGPL